MLNFSPSCERNQQPIFEQLDKLLVDSRKMLEIGSGSGQHALFFANQFPLLRWQPTELAMNHEALQINLAAGSVGNILAPKVVDVCQPDWGVEPVDVVFTANTLHIMGWAQVKCFFSGVGASLEHGGQLIVYGPFRYAGEYTSASNAEFDMWLQQRDPDSGIRDFLAVNALAEAEGLRLTADVTMPANNQLLVWQKSGKGM